jgi:outer membrane receptor protein involved in Fe transport
LEWQQHWGERWQSRLALSHIAHPGSAIHSESNNLLGGSLSYQHKGLTATLLLNYQSEKIDPNEQDYPANISTIETTRFGGRSIWGAHIAYQLQTDWELYLHADNLLAKEYLNPAGHNENYYGVPGTGRTVTAGMRWFY